MCSDTDPSVADGPIPGSAPPGTTSMSGLPRTTHSANTMKMKAAAAPSAPLAAGARHATNNVPATSIVKVMSAESAWPLISTISIAPNR